MFELFYVFHFLSLHQARGCDLIGIHNYPDLESHIRRFEDRGWSRVESIDMKTASDRLFSGEELSRCFSSSSFFFFFVLSKFNSFPAFFPLVNETET